MMQYKELQIDFGDKTYVFVTRGRSKPFSTEEAVSYLQEKGETPEPFSEKAKEVEEKSEFSVPDSRHRRNLFMQDLQQGIDFCVKKYGVGADAIIAEARRIAPGHDAERLSGKTA